MDRVIMITGANNGIGLAMAKSLVEMGDRVAGLDLSGENLSVLTTQHPDRLCFYACDVTDRAHVQEVVSNVVAQWQKVDVLVNCACLALFKPFVQRSQEEIRREFEVNYFGYLNMIEAVLPVLRRQRRGVIHNFSSGVGISGFPGMTGYTSTKGAIEALTRTLALELSDEGISVNLMHPPLTRTKSSSPLGIPLEMMADPEQVGRGLAKQVGKTKTVLTPDAKTAIMTRFTYLIPIQMGRFLAMMKKRGESMAEKPTQVD